MDNKKQEIMKVEATKVNSPATLVQAPAVDAGFDPYRMAHQALRGWYWLVILLGVAAAAGGGYLGWRKGKALYRSEGLVRISYTVPAVLRESEQNLPVEMFEAFLQSQVALLSSRRLVDAALHDSAWMATGRGDSPLVVESFGDNLRVEHKGNTDYLRISFSDIDPATAAAAVQAVINTYARVYNDQHDQFQRQRLQVLEDRRKELSAELTDWQTQMRAIAKDVGPSTADRLYDSAVLQVTKMESTLTDIRLALVLAHGQSVVPFTVQQIAAGDAVMRGYLADRNRLEDQLLQMRLRHYGESHSQVIECKKAQELVNERIMRYADEFRDMQATMSKMPATTNGGNGLAGQSVESLRADEAGVARLYERAKAEMVLLGDQRLRIYNLKADAEKVEKELGEVTQRIHYLQLESAGVIGRMNIISSGEAPLSPYQDRRLAMAGIGALGAGCIPAVLVVLLGLIKPRYRFSDETAADLSGRMPLLGILPTLSSKLNDTEQAADAAQCVHQIRVMLQLSSTTRSGATYLVTSASPGEGKTSLVAALALSFAASGSKTLLIDCDLVGQRLTTGFGKQGTSGVVEALRGGSIAEHVQPTSQEGLWILPVGHAHILHASTMSGAAVDGMLSESRGGYDVVLIDSGPILGSVEASVIGPKVDGVVLAISRRQRRPLVDRAVRQLDSIGAKLAGVVFNRADRADFQRSVQATSLRSMSSQSITLRTKGADIEQSRNLGPLVRSVAALLPPS